jgi:beta-galactosidase
MGKNGDLPYMAVEFGTPLYASLMRGRDGYTHQGNSEPHLTEWAAVYLGNDAYRLEPKELSKIFLERYKGTNPQQEYEPHLRTDGYDKILWGSPSFAKLQNLFFRNTWRSWRTMGVTGGMIPWHQTDDQLYPELYANNGPSLAWIAGPAGEFSKKPSVPNFTRKDHHFLPGKTMKKQIVLINDHRSPQKFSARWTVRVGGKTISQGNRTGTLAVAEKLFLPADVLLPKGVAGGRADGRFR